MDHVDAALGIITPDEIDPDPATHIPSLSNNVKKMVNPSEKKEIPITEPSENPIPIQKMTLLEETRRLYTTARCRCGEIKTHVLLPCSHLECCERCAKNKQACPRCNEKITDVIRTFLS